MQRLQNGNQVKHAVAGQRSVLGVLADVCERDGSRFGDLDGEDAVARYAFEQLKVGCALAEVPGIEALDVEETCRFESLEDRPVEAERAGLQHPATGWNGRLDHAEVSPVSVGARRVTWGLPSRQVYSCVRCATRHMLSTSCTRWSR